jgi:hypothetical protein
LVQQQAVVLVQLEDLIPLQPKKLVQLVVLVLRQALRELPLLVAVVAEVDLMMDQRLRLQVVLEDRAGAQMAQPQELTELRQQQILAGAGAEDHQCLALQALVGQVVQEQLF